LTITGIGRLESSEMILIISTSQDLKNADKVFAFNDQLNPESQNIRISFVLI